MLTSAYRARPLQTATDLASDRKFALLVPIAKRAPARLTMPHQASDLNFALLVPMPYLTMPRPVVPRRAEPPTIDCAPRALTRTYRARPCLTPPWLAGPLAIDLRSSRPCLTRPSLRSSGLASPRRATDQTKGSLWGALMLSHQEQAVKKTRLHSR